MNCGSVNAAAWAFPKEGRARCERPSDRRRLAWPTPPCDRTGECKCVVDACVLYRTVRMDTRGRWGWAAICGSWRAKPQAVVGSTACKSPQNCAAGTIRGLISKRFLQLGAQKL